MLFSFSQAAWDALTPEGREELTTEFVSALRLKGDRILDWVTALNDICGRLASGAETASDLPVFWIRLQGLVTEIAPAYKERTFAATNDVQKHLLRIAADGAKLCLAIAIELTEDELLYVDYRRSLEAHFFVNSYFLRGRDRSGLLELSRERHIPALDRKISLRQIRDAVTRIESRGAEIDVARGIAARLRPLTAAFATWMTAKYPLWPNSPLQPTGSAGG